MGLQVCKLVLFDTLIWQSNGDGLHLRVVPVLGVNVLGEPSDEEGVLEQASVGPVPRDRIVWVVGNEYKPEIQHKLQFHTEWSIWSQNTTCWHSIHTSYTKAQLLIQCLQKVVLHQMNHPVFICYLVVTFANGPISKSIVKSVLMKSTSPSLRRQPFNFYYSAVQINVVKGCVN